MRSSKRKFEKNGNVKDFERRSIPGALFGAAALGVVRNFIKLFVLGALALWLVAKPFKKMADAAYAEPLKAIGWGFVLIAIGCLAVFIIPLVFVLVGILLGFLSLGSLLYFWFGIVGTVFCWLLWCSSLQYSQLVRYWLLTCLASG